MFQGRGRALRPRDRVACARLAESVFAVGLFIVVLAPIAFELVNRTVVVLLGAAILVSFGVVTQEEAASESIGWNTAWLLAGMLAIFAILERRLRVPRHRVLGVRSLPGGPAWVGWAALRA